MTTKRQRFEGTMYALFLLAPADLEKLNKEPEVKIKPHGNGRMSVAVGPIQNVMFLIGAVAGNGENCLYKAECL